MSEPPNKRRRTSSPAEDERQSSPLRKPARRPSFASPTKSSLARGYPNLLRPTSAGPPAPRDILARGKQARASVPAETNVQPDQGQEALAGESAREGTAGALDEEPQSPTTPSHRRLEEQDGPRRGVLFSSPSKRPPRRKDPVKQPPLKPRAPSVQEDHLSRSVEDGPVDDHDTQNAAQKKQPPDPEIEKRKQEKARLKRELEELEAQVSRCTQEINKEQQRAPDQALRLTERGGLTDFIAKVSGADVKEDQPVPVSSLLCSFLPFSVVPVPQPRSKQLEKPIPSHRPVELADPLPYLEMFTAFKFSTRLGLPRGKVFPSSNRVHQKHTVDIVGPQKLLTAQVSIVIDTLANEIIDLHVLRLSSWAERELGTFIRGKAKEKDLGNACWAIDSYWDIATKRAQYWHKCETAFAHLITGHMNEDAENARLQTKSTASSISRRDLNRHLGRDTLVLQDKHVLLKLNWRIGFDWSGEAESEVTVEPVFPQVWSEADTAASFKKIPDTFTSLLRNKGAFEATRVMVALLFAQ